MCLDNSAIEKEATNFAFSTSNDQHLELIRLSWEACTAYIMQVLQTECEGSYALEVVQRLLDLPPLPPLE